MSTSLESFVAKTKTLLQTEKEAEIAENRALLENVRNQELQRRGVCLLRLRLSSQHTGLYGRTVLVFEPAAPAVELVSHNFSPGDIAGLSLSNAEGSNDQIASGIVSRVNRSTISVAFEQSQNAVDAHDDTHYKLVKLANDVTHRRLKRALEQLEAERSGSNGRLVEVLFGETPLGPPLSQARDGDKYHDAEMAFFNPALDDSQKEAVRFALRQRELSIIHGPPGTGKTTTVIEIVRQAVAQKLKVLVCAPSNIAVDNLVERLAAAQSKVVRLGHPARLLHSIQRYSLDAILAASDETKLVSDVRKDMDETLRQLRSTRDGGGRHRLREEMKSLKRELRQREVDATVQILKRADVVTATLTGASRDDGPLKVIRDAKDAGQHRFDLVVIDECSQAMEAACWIALPWAPRCVLAGDHNQLPPTIISQQAADDGLALTLMERLLKLYGDACMRMLRVQYRMHDAIMRWPSQQLYGGQLTAHESVASHLLKDLVGVQTTDDTATALLLIDTAGCNMPELDLPAEMSKANEGEVDLVAAHTDRLICSGLSADSIAIITPYNLQVEFLRLKISQKHPNVEIKSVDGFQGREKEAVIISMVRSNEQGEVGFLAENRRINVAITRARRHLAVICDTETVGHDTFLDSLVKYLSEEGEVRCAQQYIDEGAVSGECIRPESFERRSAEVVKVKANKKKEEAGKVKRRTKPGNIEEPRINKEKSDTNNEEAYENLEKILATFVADNQSEYRFPPSLNSHDRLIVHQIAEKLGLLHCSEGEGKQRQIVVRKTANPTKQNESSDDRAIDKLSHKNTDFTIADSDNNTHTSSTQSQLGTVEITTEEAKSVGHKTDAQKLSTEMVTCDQCGQAIPSKNLTLHKLRCARHSGHMTKTKSSKKREKNATKPTTTDEDDFDELIAAAQKENATCAQPRCDVKTKTLGIRCELCTRRFCLTHSMPEVHGCGDQARAAAKAAARRPAPPTSGKAAVKHTHLQRRLEKKLGEMEAKRRPKQKEK